MGQLVDEAHPRTAPQDGLEIQGVPAQGQHLQAFQQRSQSRAVLGTDPTHHHVLAPGLTPTSLLQQTPGLARV
jgi:hypothetical protein